jgi:hypothetical protein
MQQHNITGLAEIESAAVVVQQVRRRIGAVSQVGFFARPPPNDTPSLIAF